MINVRSANFRRTAATLAATLAFATTANPIRQSHEVYQVCAGGSTDYLFEVWAVDVGACTSIVFTSVYECDGAGGGRYVSTSTNYLRKPNCFVS
jgi:hypothetical protein